MGRTPQSPSLRQYLRCRKDRLDCITLEADASPDVLIEVSRPDRPGHVARAHRNPEDRCPPAYDARVRITYDEQVDMACIYLREIEAGVATTVPGWPDSEASGSISTSIRRGT